MPAATEKFKEIKNQIKTGSIELSLDEFSKDFLQYENLFKDLAFDVSNINIIENTERKIRIKAFSKDFLFRKTLFKNESVVLDLEFILTGDKLDIVAVCKPDKPPQKLSNFPGSIGKLLKPFDFLQIHDMAYIISSAAIDGISTGTLGVNAGSELKIKPGITIAGFIDLNKSNNVADLLIKNLKPVIGQGPYFMSWNILDKISPDFNLKLPKDISIEGLFKLKAPALSIRFNEVPSFSIDGIFELTLPALPPIGTLGGFVFSPEGISGEFNLSSLAKDLKAPFGYPGVHLDSLTVSAGISNLGIANLGAGGTFYIGPDKPADISSKSKVAEIDGIRSNEYKFKFDIIPGKITPKFCYLYLDKVTLEEYLKALSNKSVKLPEFFSKISMEQVMFHWCETKTGEAKPDGTIAMPYFGFSGIANMFGHKSFIEVLATNSNQSKGKLILDPINIGNGLLKITGKGAPPAGYKGKTTVKPGGVTMAFNSGGPDYFSFSGKIELLGIKTEMEGEVKNNGMSVKAKSDIAGIFKDEISVILHDQVFAVAAKLDVGIKGGKIDLPLNLGRISLKTSVHGDFDSEFKAGKLKTSISAKFELVGMKFDVGTFTVDISNVNEIPEALLKYIEKHAEKIFAKMLKDADLWLNAIKEKLISAGEKIVGEVLKNVYGKTPKEIAKLTNKILDFKPVQIVEALEGAGETASNMVKILSDLDIPDKEIAAAIKKVIPHAKVSVSMGHTDIGAKAHLDHGAKAHINKGAKAHLDKKPLGIHTDIGGRAHVDHAAKAHVDEKARAHVDTKNHIDI